MKKRLHWRRVERANTARAQAAGLEEAVIRERGQAAADANRADPGRGAGVLDEVEDHDVYPDIIVHRRSEPSALNDLLVIEVKKEESDGHEDDREKLRAFMGNPFCYQHAAFVILPRDGGLPCLEWITPPECR